MEIKDLRIVSEGKVIGMIDEGRKVIEIFNKNDVKMVLEYFSGLNSYNSYSWETYSHCD